MSDMVSNGYLKDKNGKVMEIVDKAARDGVNRLTEEIKTSVPVIQTATVGQTIAVKAVDENGKPTEWEAVDAASGGESGTGGVVLWEDYSRSFTNGDTIPVDISAFSFVEVTFKATMGDTLYGKSGMIVGIDAGVACKIMVSTSNLSIIVMHTYLRYDAKNCMFTFDERFNIRHVYNIANTNLIYSNANKAPIYPVRIVGYE